MKRQFADTGLGLFFLSVMVWAVSFAAAATGAEPAVEDEFKIPQQLGEPDKKQFPELKRITPKWDVWIDGKNKQVVVRAGVCLRKGAVELLACNHRWIKDSLSGKKVRQGTKEYESVVTINAPAAVIHAALLAVGAESGSPVKFSPYKAAHGTKIKVTLHWKDAQGRKHHAPAQQWIRNSKTKKPLQHEWVFAGSRFVKVEETGQEHYLAEGGNVICVSNFSDAMLDLPIRSSQRNTALIYEAFTQHIPPVGTPVTVVLKPQVKK